MLACLAHTGASHLPTSMQKSPLMVPGLESAGLVSPSITRPVFTTFRPSHTYNKINPKQSAEGTREHLVKTPRQVRTHHGDDWTRAHVLDQASVEGPVLQVNVVLLQKILRSLEQQRTMRAMPPGGAPFLTELSGTQPMEPA